jgi:predicted flap endonuclease-1-like 5' DNA nuclease
VTYLISQITVFLVIATGVGFALGWLVRGARLAAGGSPSSSPEHAVERAKAMARVARGELAAKAERLNQVEEELIDVTNELAMVRNVLAAVEGAGQVSPVAIRRGKLAIEADEAPTGAGPAPPAPRPREVESEPLPVVPVPVAGAVAEPPAPAAPPPAEAVAGPGADVSLIRGVGPATVKILNQLGYTTVADIARWGDEDVARVVAAKSALKSRIARDRWVEQARAIVAGS